MTRAPAPGADSSPRARGRRTLVALLSAVVAGLLTLSGLPATTAPAAAAPEGEVSVEITDVAPAVLTPGRALTVRGEVRNGTSAEIGELYLNLRLQQNPPTSRRLLDLWFDLRTAFATRSLAEEVVDEPLAAGGRLEFSLTAPPENLGLSSAATAWGPRGLGVNASYTLPEGERATATARTATVWVPAEPTARLSASVLVPFTRTAAELTASVPPATEPTAADAADAADGESPAALPVRLATLAREAAVPGATWALDPALLALGDPGPAGEAGDSGPPADQGTSDQAPADPGAATDEGEGEVAATSGPLLDPAADVQIVALPFGDADAVALLRHQRADLLRLATERGAEAMAEAGLTPVPAPAWPGSTTTDPELLAALAEAGAGAVVLPSAAVPAQVNYTATGRAVVGDVPALLYEEDLSSALAGEVDAPAGTSPALAARQYLLATSALVALERPNDPRHVLLAPPRGAALGDRLAALAEAPWITLEPASVLLARDPVPARAQPVADPGAAEGEIGDAALRAVAGALDSLAGLRAIVADPRAIDRAAADRLLEVLSVAWRADPQARGPYLGEASAVVGEAARAVGVEASGPVNLISASGELPVTVRNGLDQDVTVRLRITSSDPALQIGEPVEVTILAESVRPVPVPVRAVGRADVEIFAQLLTPQGEPVGVDARWTVRVRADWESVGTAVVAAGVLAGFLVGVVRNVRRVRRRGGEAR